MSSAIASTPRSTRATAASGHARIEPITRRAVLMWTGGALVGACTQPKTSPHRHELLIEHARVHGAPNANSVLIVGDAIAQVGRDLRRPSRTIDARGGLVVPGFHDAHVHARSGGLMLDGAQLEGLTSLDAVLAKVRSFAASHPGDGWLRGRGWSYDIVPEGSFPTRHDLDRVTGNRPIYLESYDGHAGWVNSAALSRAGVDASTADPADGRIVREADGRTPQGTLLEGATELVEKHIPAPSEAEERAALARAVAHLSSLGVTSMDDIATDPATLSRYAALELPLGVSVSLPLDGDLDHYRQYPLGFLKGFVDGVIESKTAFMLEPYVGSDTRGAPLIEPTRLHALVKRATQAGFRVALHAIGDAAVRLSLDAFEKAGRPRRGRHRIEHIEVVHADDVPRFAALGVVASMQPYHAVPGDDPNAGVWSQNLGPERLARSFAWKRLLDAGATLAFGSDWPVMSADPLWGLAVALTRKNERGLPKEGWHAEQCLTADAALAAYSRGPATALGVDHAQRADLVVLAPEVRLEDPSTLWHGKRIGYVIAGGRVVHGN